MLRVSCIIPVYNGEKYLAEAIRSVLDQTYRPFEILVADDGSTDGTRDLVSSFGNNVRYLRQENSGPAAARNFGLGAATGDLVAFLDSDDLWDSKKLALQADRFSQRSELDYCLAHARNFWMPELREEAEKYQAHRISGVVPAYLTGTLVARRRIFETVGVFNRELAHGDATEWFMRAAERGAVMEMLPDVLLYRRLHASNLSRLQRSNSREEYLRILKSSLDRRRHSDPTF